MARLIQIDEPHMAALHAGQRLQYGPVRVEYTGENPAPEPTILLTADMLYRLLVLDQVVDIGQVKIDWEAGERAKCLEGLADQAAHSSSPPPDVRPAGEASQADS